MPLRPKNDTLTYKANLRGYFYSLSRIAFRPIKVLFLGYGIKTIAV